VLIDMFSIHWPWIFEKNSVHVVGLSDVYTKTS